MFMLPLLQSTNVPPEIIEKASKISGDTLAVKSIELVQAMERTPRKIFEKPRQWGDPGYIQICFDVVNMRA